MPQTEAETRQSFNDTWGTSESSAGMHLTIQNKNYHCNVLYREEILINKVLFSQVLSNLLSYFADSKIGKPGSYEKNRQI